MTKTKLYTLVSVFSIAGYIWLVINYQSSGVEPENNIQVCLIKHATNIPCPSCGSTRSVLLLLHGDLSEALYTNPLGVVTALMLFTFPLWMLFDVIKKRDGFYRFYQHTEICLRKKWIAFPSIILVLLLWIWNVYKGL